MTTVRLQARPLRNQRGASALEYALVIALVGLVVLTALGTLGTKISEYLGLVEAQIPATL
ncbi:MAG: hypothetical protein A3F42_02325 [Gammaproteobacteria bacterium RIFCSPHIGHO2_12_FULL_37_34]|nr:MAG: hypothetical protein A3F42_02325 [Gammaproteobacteria bacterium RIFCSPHIGHO2_12_FULL_37_34]